ncbi:glycosyl transferase [Staphylococcus succinus]|uniref:Glycosyl transferase n=1 Tax=Staphylococcus succinus TaxID=61015 RepID=A0ABX5IM18_9STAP|nr:macrolide family glycosyltransferase [Staphylococcus succinus]MBU0438782.1 glycosyltransferase [Staphylococcus succinus]MEB8123873.1 glycosyltransferase [Staphylococcus succinus]MEB8127633.1 glycosyltransferase [Staphylococcus succinus]MEB8210465.1 glycosyltransferase [Staphylococcus succinus]PKI21234.1 glycosyl transferase [Staphylococcus succinus]
MAKVLFINPGPSGHLNPAVAVSKTLVERGEDVVFYANAHYKEKLSGTGVELRIIPSEPIVEAFTTYGMNHLFNVINGLLKTTDIILPQILEDVQHEHYDYLIHDSMFGCGHLVSQKLNIPTISTVTSFNQTTQMFDDFTKNLATTLTQDEVDNANAAFDELKQHVEYTYNVDVPSRFEVMNNPGDLNLSYVMEKFQIDYASFDSERNYFAGPSVIQPQPSGFMDEIDRSRPIIYISLGTIFNQNIAFFNKCFKALKDLNVTVVVSIGNENRLEDFEDIPDNFIIKAYVPQTELLQYTSLFLTHAGMNSTNESMMMGVPMLAFPQSADQPVVAQQIEDLNLGQQLNAETMTPEILKQTVLDMLGNLEYYQHNIDQIRDTETNQRPGYELAVDRILAFRDQNCK